MVSENCATSRFPSLLSPGWSERAYEMTVFVNDRQVDILPGMTVKHALAAAGLLKEMEASKKVCDEWGNEIGLDGALSEGAKIYVG